MAVIDEPAAAIAASRCVTARSLADGRRGAVTANHLRPCAWCDYPLDELVRMVEGWNAWAHAKDRGRGVTYDRHDARVFAELPRAEQERRVVEAQGLVDPTPAPRIDPAPPVDDEVLSWL